MVKQSGKMQSRELMEVLSEFLLRDAGESNRSPDNAGMPARRPVDICHDRFDELLALADSNHVVIRGLGALLGLARQQHDAVLEEKIETTLAKERDRIAAAIGFLGEICGEFANAGCQAVVIKSLDHWPDLGSDLDLFTSATPEAVFAIMHRFHAAVAPRSWGDRLACKWNFNIPGLREAVEVHVGRLGQTGEHVSVGARLIERSRFVDLGGHKFRVPSVSDRLMIGTMQRMYRHFYFRLCDVVDTFGLAERNEIDFLDLRNAALAAGIWEGVATYLAIVSDYVLSYRGRGLDLPRLVTAAARFGGDQIHFSKSFLRVPILPHSARLYGSQLAGVLGRGEFQSGARLGLLPWLATAAVIGQKLTGSDKGIW